MNSNQYLECFVCNFRSNAENFDYLYHHDKWDLYKCSKCTFQFWWPIEQAPHIYFEKEYKTFADIQTKPNFGFNHKIALKLIPLKKGKLLDVGCGDSLFLPKIQQRGFEAWGIDFNRRAIEKAKKLFRLENLYPLSIYDFIRFPKLPRFDLITFFEVIEHIGDPRKFIITVKTLLNKNGFIIFSVPDADTYGRWEETVNVPPHHLTRWTEKTLKIFLSNNGFLCVNYKKINRIDSGCLLMNILLKFFRFINPLRADECVKGNIGTLWRYVSFPFREILYFLGIRPTIFVIAQLKN